MPDFDHFLSALRLMIKEKNNFLFSSGGKSFNVNEVASIELVEDLAPESELGNNITILRTTSAAIIKALTRRELLKKLSPEKKRMLEDMFVRLLSSYTLNVFEELLDEKLKLDPIRLKEWIEVEMLMAEPDVYFIGNWKEILIHKSLCTMKNGYAPHWRKKQQKTSKDYISLFALLDISNPTK